MKALADPRSAEGRQEIQAIKASICDLYEALAKSKSRRSGHSELVAQHAAEIQRPSERGGKGRCARSQPAWALSGPPHFFVPPTRPEWMGSSGRKAQLSVCWQRQAASYI